ncbi:MAG TPA: BrnA antitoxin family protein [Terriglobales bacterium]|nr:BrnA antitoxin family protein [Terriglobales bacterium]
MRIADFYKPLKKPVTLRLDADVIAWFKKDGRRYQTRINEALRKVMEKELKASER